MADVSFEADGYGSWVAKDGVMTDQLELEAGDHPGAELVVDPGSLLEMRLSSAGGGWWYGTEMVGATMRISPAAHQRVVLEVA